VAVQHVVLIRENDIICKYLRTSYSGKYCELREMKYQVEDII